jgi:hypothetical protein
MRWPKNWIRRRRVSADLGSTSARLPRQMHQLRGSRGFKTIESRGGMTAGRPRHLRIPHGSRCRMQVVDEC